MRIIDADRLKVVLEKNYGHTGGAAVLAQLIDEQPTIQPERKKGKWIPVAEGLPEIDMGYPHHEDYLVQYNSGDMDVASWSNVNRFWTDRVTEPHWNCVQFAKVVAWMPLPGPWRGEKDGKQT